MKINEVYSQSKLIIKNQKFIFISRFKINKYYMQEFPNYRPYTTPRVQFPRKRVSLDSLTTLLDDSKQKFPRYNQPDLVEKYFRPLYKNYVPIQLKIPIIKQSQVDIKKTEEQMRRTFQSRRTEMKKYISVAIQKNLQQKRKSLSALHRKGRGSLLELYPHKQNEKIKSKKNSPTSEVQLKIQKYIKQKSLRKGKNNQNPEKQRKKLESKKQTQTILQNLIFHKQKNSFDFLRKGSNTTKKIVSTILKKKLSQVTISPAKQLTNYDAQLVKKYNSEIPIVFQEYIGKNEMIKMARIFKGFEAKQIQIVLPQIQKRCEQVEEKVVSGIGEGSQSRVQVISGWQLQHKQQQQQ